MVYLVLSGAAWALALVCLAATFRRWFFDLEPDYVLIALFVSLILLGGIAYDTGDMALVRDTLAVCAATI